MQVFSSSMICTTSQKWGIESFGQELLRQLIEISRKGTGELDNGKRDRNIEGRDGLVREIAGESVCPGTGIRPVSGLSRLSTLSSEYVERRRAVPSVGPSIQGIPIVSTKDME